MHNLNILHLDIKAANILINEECVVKLAVHCSYFTPSY